jgi:RNAse (barnase) inhibitor barstar
MAQATYIIDGTRLSTLEGFYDEIEREVLAGAPWGRNLDALNDIMRGDVRISAGEFRLLRRNVGLSQRRRPDTGPASSATLYYIISENANVELVFE